MYILNSSNIMSRHCAVRTTVDNKHNCEDKIGRVLIMLNYIYKT